MLFTTNRFSRALQRSGRRSPFSISTPLRETVSLVVAAYNVAPYIDQFFASVTSQSTGLRHVEVIVVDDGSTDDTAKIAKFWAKRFPNTIKYIYQENQGVSGARNTGMAHATGKWISFPDPDDFFDPYFFHFMNKEIRRKHKVPLLMISARFVLYWEARDKFEDKHPLTYRFTDTRTELRTNDLGDFIQLTTNTAWIDRDKLVSSGLIYDKTVKPSFEDAHLLNHLFLREQETSVVFLRDAVYNYRKRAANNSLVNNAKLNPVWYLNQLVCGNLDLLRTAKELLGFVPESLQNLMIYDIGWRYKHLVTNLSHLEVLSPDEQVQFVAIVAEIFEYVDAHTIENFSRSPIGEVEKIALLGIHKNSRKAKLRVYVREYDPVENLLCLQYSSHGGVLPVEVRVAGELAPTFFPSKRTRQFFGSEYLTQIATF